VYGIRSSTKLVKNITVAERMPIRSSTFSVTVIEIDW